MSVEAVEDLARRAIMDGGRQLSQWRDGRPRRLIEWDIAMQCETPRSVELYARHSAQHGLRKTPMCVIMHVRCRKCTWCKNMRQRFWTGRAMREYSEAPRTWMGTLTCNLDEHIKIYAAARVRHARHGVDFDGLPDREKFEARCIELGAHATLWLKRLRKHGARFRYLLIAEAHDSGSTSDGMRHRPHIHMLIHERVWGSVFDGDTKWVKDQKGVWHEMMPDQAFARMTWPLGFTRFEAARDARTLS